MLTVSSIDDAVESFYLSRDLSGCTRKTIGNYRKTMKDFLRSSPSWPLTVLDVQRYVGGMRSRKGRNGETGLKPSTIAGRLAIVKAFTSWAQQAGLLPENPAKSVRFKLPKTLPFVPTTDEVSRMVKACGDDWHGTRLRAIMLVAIDTGLRMSEWCGLRWEDIDHGSHYITVRSGKGQKDRVVPYGYAVARALNRWMTKQGVVRPEDFVFATKSGERMAPTSAYGIIKRLAKRAGLAREMSPHKLRHYFATEYLRNGGDLETLRQILGHTSLMMVLRYARLVSKDIGRVHRRASPGDALDR